MCENRAVHANRRYNQLVNLGQNLRADSEASARRRGLIARNCGSYGAGIMLRLSVYASRDALRHGRPAGGSSHVTWLRCQRRVFSAPSASPKLQSCASDTTTGSLYKDQNDTWVDRSAPAAMRPYLKLMRIDRPIGTWLVLLPGWWGLALAAAPGGLPDPLLMALFGIGAFTMRGAGCTMNDMWDKDFDGKVARTAQRPLASGRLSPMQAWRFLGGQLSAGLGVLLCLNWPTVKLGFLAVPLAGIYPAMKRLTHWPQAVLGLAMNYGILMGYTAATGADLLPKVLPDVTWPGLLTLAGYKTGTGASSGPASGPGAEAAPASGIGADSAAGLVTDASVATAEAAATSAPAASEAMSQLLASASGIGGLAGSTLAAAGCLYGGAALWTIVYDTIYAHQDKGDDAALGLKSTALLFADRSRAVLTALALGSGAAWTAAGVAAGLAWPYFVGAAACTAHQLWQVRTADFSDRLNLTARFVSNKHVGWLMLAGIIAGRLMQAPLL